MTPEVLQGQRCRSRRPVESASGRFDRATEGRIRYISENLGRVLVVVDWDQGGSCVLFPDEVDLIASSS